MKTKVKTAGWLRRYQAALGGYLKQGSVTGLDVALRLGRQAVALGLETLDLAQLHEQALTELAATGGSSSASPRRARRSKSFFNEVIVPIEKTHPTALKDDVRVDQLSQTLHQRTLESSASDRRLKQSVVSRQASEAALEKSGKNRAKLVQESHRLQKRLRLQTGAIISAQENEWKKNSRKLHNEIAQTLLAINFGLLALKTTAKANTDKIAKEIAKTQRLVRKSVITINRVAHEFDTKK